MDADKAYSLGLAWGATFENFILYPEMQSFAAFERQVGGEWADEFFGDWEDGVMAAPKIIAGDGPLGVRGIAEITGFDRSYIKAEIQRGKLISRLVPASIGKPYHEVQPADFIEWVNKTQRGERGNRSRRPVRE